MRISDWSSDVCSSDLVVVARPGTYEAIPPDALLTKDSNCQTVPAHQHIVDCQFVIFTRNLPFFRDSRRHDLRGRSGGWTGRSDARRGSEEGRVGEEWVRQC